MKIAHPWIGFSMRALCSFAALWSAGAGCYVSEPNYCQDDTQCDTKMVCDMPTNTCVLPRVIVKKGKSLVDGVVISQVLPGTLKRTGDADMSGPAADMSASAADMSAGAMTTDLAAAAPPGIDCGSHCSAEFTKGTHLKLVPMSDPAAPYKVSWTVDSQDLMTVDSTTVNPQEQSFELILNSPISLTITFIPNCLSTEDCIPAANQCSSDYKCRCYGKLACGGGTPICSNVDMDCVPCTADGDCHTSKTGPFCVNSACVACRGDAGHPNDCPSDRPHCDSSHECAECLANTDCHDAKKPYCNNGTCAACNATLGCADCEFCSAEGVCVSDPCACCDPICDRCKKGACVSIPGCKM